MLFVYLLDGVCGESADAAVHTWLQMPRWKLPNWRFRGLMAIMLKLGLVSVPLYLSRPDASHSGRFDDYLSLIAMIYIRFGRCSKDMKKLVAYSSIAHGFR